MLVKIKSPMKIIHKAGLVEFDIGVVNGMHVLKTATFKQNLKKSAYDAIMANQVEAPKKEKAETKAQIKAREKKEADAKAKEEADADAKAGEQAPPVDEEPQI